MKSLRDGKAVGIFRKNDIQKVNIWIEKNYLLISEEYKSFALALDYLTSKLDELSSEEISSLIISLNFRLNEIGTRLNSDILVELDPNQLGTLALLQYINNKGIK